MKKLALLLLALLAVAVAAVYYFIPDPLVVSAITKSNCIPDAAFRNIAEERNWAQWWPRSGDTAGGNPAAGKSFVMGKYKYTVSKKVPNNFEILIETGNDSLFSEMNLLSFPHDSTLIKWHFTMPASSNIFKRIAAYSKAAAIKNDMDVILNNLQPYLSNFRNVYGFPYLQLSTKDTILVSTKSFSAGYPSTDFIYNLIDKLRHFAGKTGLMVTGMPMLNVTNFGTTGYNVMVALPVNRTTDNKDSVSVIKMVPGRFIVTDVTGGPQTIQQTHQQILNYFQDYRRITMAIPFEYLVTDRQKEKDSSKWLTRIYSPVY